MSQLAFQTSLLHPRYCEEPQATCLRRSEAPASRRQARQSRQKTGSPRDLSVARDDDLDLINDQPDRLSAAKNFADELNEARLWKIKISYQKRWTKHRRVQQSMKIQGVKPWHRATGPKTAAGKNRAAQNWCAGMDTLEMETRAALRAHGHFLTLLMRAHRLKDEKLLSLCRVWGMDITARLERLAPVFLTVPKREFDVTRRNKG
jgi:hypothetical protein